MIEKEKNLEKRLHDQVVSRGGWTIKLSSYLVGGLPDRLCLFPGGKAAFVEVKETGKKPTKLQLLTHRRLKQLGFEVVVIDSSEKIEKLCLRIQGSL